MNISLFALIILPICSRRRRRDEPGVLLLRDVGREHLGELLVLQAAAQELVFRQVAVAVLQGKMDRLSGSSRRYS